MPDETYVLTGATSGLGRALAIILATRGASLVLVGRRADKGQSLVEELRSVASGAAAIEFIRADVSRLDDVRALAARVRRRYPVVDCLINNAGARFDLFGETPEGIERTFATNYLGHFLLTQELGEPLRRSQIGRLVTIGSSSHAAADVSSGWLFSREAYDRRLAYANAKLASTVFGLHLAGRVTGSEVSSIVVDPGIVLTNFARNNGFVSWLRHFGVHAVRGEVVRAARVARAIATLARLRVPAAAARYYHRSAGATPSPLAGDSAIAESLWQLSTTLVTQPAASQWAAR